MTSLLELREITRTFTMPDAPALRILTGVDLNVEPGEHVAIVGRSGTGKSTLLNILGLIDLPTSGMYRLDDVEAASLGERRRAHLRGRTFGFVFQSFNLISGLSTTENVAAPLLYDHGTAFWRRTKHANELLDAVGLGDKTDSSIEKLSGGEQQRVAIARALARQPRVILADEPTGALDVDTGTVVMELLERQCHETGAALIIITHDLAVAARAHTQYRLDHGVLTRIRVTHDRVGSLDEFGETVLPDDSARAHTDPGGQLLSRGGAA
ncbi:ABC transporter ATP-binding protein [Actinomyces oricola]|uniref:ABC transporter ATP-binding protein n=1 Tax=Actinomyces oricola TaxID=206043 RepID=UPI0019D426F9|nr:ABC transporter ATP-binding protein [Actinomyces oricola]